MGVSEKLMKLKMEVLPVCGLKKITEFFVSAVTVLTLMSASIFSSFASDVNSELVPDNSVFSASSVWDKDPNGDGVLDVYDMIYLRRYLSGLSGPTNLDDYDINSNGLITPFDTWVLEAHLNGILPANVDDNYTENAVSSAVSSRYYWKHDCNSNVGSSHTVYKIDRPITAYGNTSVSNNVSNESFSSINSIPSTDYVKLDDNQAVVFLGMHGTGFIISDHVIAVSYTHLTLPTN